MSDDMATMPVRELIGGLREKAESAIDNDNDVLKSLVFNVLANRLEQEANWSDRLQKFLDENVPTWRDEIERENKEKGK